MFQILTVIVGPHLATVYQVLYGDPACTLVPLGAK